MKKLLGAGIAVVFAMTAVLTGCADVGANGVSVSSVNSNKLEASGATKSVDATNYEAFLNKVKADDSINDSFDQFENDKKYEISASKDVRSTTVNQFASEVQSSLKAATTGAADIAKNFEGEIKIGIKNKGKVTDLPAGLYADINAFKADVKVTKKAEKTIGLLRYPTDLAFSADANIDASVGVKPQEVLAAYDVKDVDTIVKHAYLNVAVVSGIDGRYYLDYTNNTVAPTISAKASGNAGVAFSLGISASYKDGDDVIGGKMIANGYVTTKGKFDSDEVKAVLANLGDITSDQAIAKLEAELGDSLKCHFDLSFYDDDGNKTYVAIDENDVKKSVEYLLEYIKIIPVVTE